MFKLAILLSIAALSTATDYDAILGEAVTVALTENFKLPFPDCAKFTITRTDTKCTCSGQKDLPVIELAKEGLPSTVKFIPFMVSSEEEVTKVFEVDSNTCTCVPETYPDVAAYRIINDNYYVTYGKKPRQGKIVLLNRRKTDTKAEFDAAIKSAGFEGKDYTITCDLFN